SETVRAALGAYLTQPWWLLGLGLAAAIVLRGPRDVGTFLRALAVALAAVALAGPVVPGGRQGLAVVVDVSDSVGGAALRRAAELGAGLPAPDAVVLAGAEAVNAASLPAEVPAFLATGGTDPARALRGATAGGAGRGLPVPGGAAPPGPRRPGRDRRRRRRGTARPGRRRAAGRGPALPPRRARRRRPRAEPLRRGPVRTDPAQPGRARPDRRGRRRRALGRGHDGAPLGRRRRRRPADAGGARRARPHRRAVHVHGRVG